MRTSTHTMLIARVFIAAAVCLTFSRAGRAQASYSIKDLGPFPNAQAIVPSALSDSGTVVGRIDTSTGTLPFLWQGDAITQLQVSALWPHGLATAVNGNGEVVGTLTDPSGVVEQPAYWNGGAPVLLSLLDYVGGSPVAINDAGRIVGWLFRNQEILGVYWEGGVPHPLDTPPGVSDCLPSAINNHGDVVFWQGNGSAASAFVYRNASWTTISPLPGDPELYAGAINNEGDVVGTSGDFTFDRLHAFLFHDGQAQSLIPPELGMRSSASSINDAGQVVGTANGHAYLFTRTTYQDLNTLIPRDSGWELLTASAINNKGQIVGAGVHNGQSRAFLLSPINTTIHLGKGDYTITGMGSGGVAKAVVGIVCDNLPEPPSGTSPWTKNWTDQPELADKLVIKFPNLPAAVISRATILPEGTSNTGTARVFGNEVIYYPPDEFNENPVPTDSSQITRAATRQVRLHVELSASGQDYVLDSAPIVLARAPVVLVHGINNGPMNWWPLAYEVQDPDGDSGIRVPFAVVDHSRLYHGNGQVESAALLLSQSISDTIARIRSGAPLPNGTAVLAYDLTGHRLPGWADFGDYSSVGPLAARRVDVVAWSYGGVITRWYIASDGSNPSQPNDLTNRWYNRWYGDVFVSPEAETLTYHRDVRKVITLGSMWRGVPLANYLNEITFSATFPMTKPTFDQAPTAEPLVLGSTMLDFVDRWVNPFVPCFVPSMEVMAIDSPWMRYLIYGRGGLDGSQTLAHPFDDNIAYGSVVGDDKRYPISPVTVGPLGTGDIYATIDLIQQPSWFPYLPLEQRPNTFLEFSHNFSDGLVPVWSAAIPHSYQIVSAPHDGFATNAQTLDWVLRWLNSGDLSTDGKGLKLGQALNPRWNEDVIQDQDSTDVKRWSFAPMRMAPYPESDLYAQERGIGRLDPQAVGGGAPRLELDHTVTVSRNGTAIQIDAEVKNTGTVLAPGVMLLSATLIVVGRDGASVQVFPLTALHTIRPGASAPLHLVFQNVPGTAGSKALLRVSGTSLFPGCQISSAPAHLTLP